MFNYSCDRSSQLCRLKLLTYPTLIHQTLVLLQHLKAVLLNVTLFHSLLKLQVQKSRMLACYSRAVFVQPMADILKPSLGCFKHGPEITNHQSLYNCRLSIEPSKTGKKWWIVDSSK